MERETYIYKKLKDFDKSSTLKDKLNDVADYLYKNYNIKVNFCEIFGNRRSFYAGVNDLFIVEDSIRLTDKFELIVENNNNLDEFIWNKLISDIKSLIIKEID
ncbi:hypothetical protein SAMN02745883_00756 [Caminicella sporogenes DSM 14501]|uniref:Uncharacterized protein n=1 Tax=Caminicella sporogenes DSM 14501 TaxID=1121266 RepID=A0A1M6N1V6_9FIRM|nr:hypothetical protein [Caminicella sporogenes]RKD22401.1 hypothetical protein BET04_05040 [Caminicella sporogenes]WIF95075.1 hypothetical protein QNI18_00080 [Caminicella sporogenes]SHJ89636.1 hypothetical protein SAMN02745883_00756 [Caminicella sporogenes DSM 14501]